jgi:hypothetical protein
MHQKRLNQPRPLLWKEILQSVRNLKNQSFGKSVLTLVSPFSLVVGVICGIFLLAVLIAVLIYIRRIRNNKKNKYTPTEVEEDLPARDALLMRHGQSWSLIVSSKL